MSHPLANAIEELRAGLDAWWDADDRMADAHVVALPEGRFVMAAHAFDPDIVRWLTYFVARRALECWEFSCALEKGSCDDRRPRRIVEELGRFLREGGHID